MSRHTSSTPNRINPNEATRQWDRTRNWAQSLVGAHFGVIEELELVGCESDDVHLAVFAGRLCRTSALNADDAPRTASGASLNESDALAACIGEAVERYSAALVGPGAVVQAQIDELPGDILTPDRFALFSRRQHRQLRHRFPFRRWRPRNRLSWTLARRLPAGDQVWIPSVFVYQPFRPAADEPLISPTLSTGLASAADKTTATFAGLCEVIERDAVALAWLGRVSPPQINFAVGDCDGDLRALIDELNTRGFRWCVFDLTTDLRVPVAAALIQGQTSLGPVVAFGSACHSNPVLALHKALVEAAHCRMYIKSLCREQPHWDVGRHFEQVTTFADHARFYTSHPRYWRALNRWWNTPHSIRWDDCPHAGSVDEATLTDLLHRIASADYDVYCADLTPPDLAPLGFCVVRALIPGLQPLHGNHAWPHLGGSRLRRLSHVFGQGTRQPWRFNPFPHPCP